MAGLVMVKLREQPTVPKPPLKAFYGKPEAAS